MEQLNLFEDLLNENNETKETKKEYKNTVNFPQNWTLLDKVNYLQRKILLNAILYYDYDKSYVTDNYYDGMSHQLVQMQKEHFKNLTEIKEKTEYGYVFFDFDGNTGFDLCSRLNKKDGEKLRGMCEYQIYRKENNN